MKIAKCKKHTEQSKLGSITLNSAQMTAMEHADADLECGRKWSCTCGACRMIQKCEEKDCKTLAYSLVKGL